MSELPSGTVTFLFTDIEGSTKRWERHPAAMAAAVARHDELMRAAIAQHRGHVFKTIGDAFCAAFPTAEDAAAAALTAQRALAEEPWDPAIRPIRVRMGLHTGDAEERDADYFGPPVNRVARLMSVGHGGQTLLSDVTEDHIRARLPEGARVRLLGKHRLKDLARPERIFQLLSSGLPSDFPRLKTQPSPLTGMLAAVVTVVLGVISFRFSTRASSEEVAPALFSPLSLYTGFKGLVLELSTLHEYVLLTAGILLLALTVFVAASRWRVARREQARGGYDPGPLARSVINQRTVAFLGLLSLTVLGAYAYQQYLWRVALPIPDGALGIALSREASAATVQAELADSLYTQGQAERVIVRELPVRFDARDTDRARALGQRIGARAVMIYRVDGEASGDQARYVAYVVFTDPAIGLAISGAPGMAEAGLPIRIKDGVPVPVLRTATLDELINAAAGVIAYDDDRARRAIEHLELALPAEPDAPNTGTVNFYLGNAYSLDNQPEPAVEAFERAVGFYEGRLRAREILGPQDSLILVKTYLARGRLASLAGDWDAALAWYARALEPRADLLARAEGLERPVDIHATYARLFTLMADANRFLDRGEDQRAWQERAADEIEALAAMADPDDGYARVQESAAHFITGDCGAAARALEEATSQVPSDAQALINAGIIAYGRERPDLAREYWQRVIRLDPNDVTARQLTANTLILAGISATYFEPTYLREAEALYREILDRDPANVAAHAAIADLATLRARANTIDTTALTVDDSLTVAKSQAVWGGDADRRQAALDAYAIVIDERRIIASELARGDPAADVAVADAYLNRQILLYATLLGWAMSGQEDQLASHAIALGDQVLADAAEVRAWTDRVLTNGAATRLDRLLAWSIRLQTLEREWSWYRFFTEDEERASALAAEFRNAVEQALSFAEAAPPGSTDEIAPLRIIYLEARILALLLDEDQSAADAHQGRSDELTRQERAERREGIGHYETFCTEVREGKRGDELLARGDAAGAQTHYEAALEANPGHAAALRGLARARFEQGDVAGAIAAATSATEAEPARAGTWADLARYALVTGDTAASDAAHERLLELAARQPADERMATVGEAIDQLHELHEARPELAPRLARVVPAFARFLDDMAADGDGTFQYPALYADLGRLALFADDAALAEPLIRQALALDPHQPASHADLGLALLATGGEAAPVIDDAITEVRDPLWRDIPEYGPERVLTLMEEEISRYLTRFPDRTERAEHFVAALRAERERQDTARRGVTDREYVSPSHGYGLTWDDRWSVVTAATEAGTDLLEVSNGSSTVVLRSIPEATDARGCLGSRIAALRRTGAWENLVPALDAAGRELRGFSGDRAHVAVIVQGEGGTSAVAYLECRALAVSGPYLEALVTIPAGQYDEQRELVNDLLATLRLAATDEGQATPVGAPGGDSIALPPLDLTVGGSDQTADAATPTIE